jgi:hypothetical protein
LGYEPILSRLSRYNGEESLKHLKPVKIRSQRSLIASWSVYPLLKSFGIVGVLQAIMMQSRMAVDESAAFLLM